MDIFTVKQLNIFLWYQNQRDTMNVNTEKLKSTREGTKTCQTFIGF
jgi:hypothetical protein